MIRSLRLPRAVSRLVLASLLALLTWSTSYSDTHYVSETGSNTFPYTSWATAADTVARAVEAASEWDTIRIAAGNYVTDTIRMKRGQVMQGAGMGITVFDSLPVIPIVVMVLEDSCILERFTLKGTGGFTRASVSHVPTATGGGVSNYGMRSFPDQAFTIRNVEFIDLNEGIAALQSDLSGLGLICVIDSCRFVDCGSAIFGTIGTIQIRDCYIKYDRRGRGIDLESGKLIVTNCQFVGYDPLTLEHGLFAIKALQCDSVVIRNNLMISTLHGRAMSMNAFEPLDTIGLGIIENNTIIGFEVHLETNRPGLIYRNNISALNVSSALFLDLQPSSNYNLTWNNTPWDSGVVRTGDTISNDFLGNMANFNAYPMFTDTLEYLLQAFSPAIDAGDPTILDADGSRSDIGYTGGPGGISYVYQDLAPKAPELFFDAGIPNAVNLKWSANHEADFKEYEVYRATLPDAAILLVTVASDTTFADSNLTVGPTLLYHIRTVDNQGNRSEPSNTLGVTPLGIGDDDGTLPAEFALYPNFPNPFNASTQITYALPEPATVKLMIYDVLGRHVSTLASASQTAGAYSTTWTGTDEQGQTVSSGVYFYRLTVGDELTTRKMLLLK